MAKFSDKSETVEVLDNTDYTSLIPSGRSNYNLYGYFFNYQDADTYEVLEDVTLNNTNPNETTLWTVNILEDIWMRFLLLRLERRDSAPSNPTKKDSYYNTIDSLPYYFDGSQWLELDVEEYDNEKVNYIISNHLRKINASDIVNSIQDNVKSRTEIGEDCCDEFLNKYIILHTALTQAQLKFQVGSHIQGLERINYIHENQ